MTSVYEQWRQKRAVGRLLGAESPVISYISPEHDTTSVSVGERPAVLVAFSTTCRYCEQNIPEWERVVERCAVDFTILTGEPVSVLRDFWEREGWSPEGKLGTVKLGSLLDPRGFADTFFVPGTPHHIFLDAQGRVVSLQTGLMRYDQLIHELGRLDRDAFDVCR